MGMVDSFAWVEWLCGRVVPSRRLASGKWSRDRRETSRRIWWGRDSRSTWSKCTPAARAAAKDAARVVSDPHCPVQTSRSSSDNLLPRSRPMATLKYSQPCDADRDVGDDLKYRGKPREAGDPTCRRSVDEAVAERAEAIGEQMHHDEADCAGETDDDRGDRSPPTSPEDQ